MKRDLRKPKKPRPGHVIRRPESKLGEDAERLFERVAEEAIHEDRDLFDTLSPNERKVVLQWVSEAIIDGKVENIVHDTLWEMDYVRKPVDIETFIKDDYYFGKVCSDLHPLWLRDLIEVFGVGKQYSEWILTGGIGTGKGQPLDGRVLTPDGWRVIGELQAGDYVIGSDGKSKRVKAVHRRGKLQLYKVSFTDGASLLVDGDHLWSVASPKDRHRGRPWRLVGTRALYRCGVKTACGQHKWHVPVLTMPVEYAPVSLPIGAYSLGALIGDGGLTGGGIRLSSQDQEIVDEVSSETGLVPHPVGNGCDYSLVFGPRGGQLRNPVLDALRELNLCKLAHEKRIPPIYLRASVGDRLRLLRGLMDTDGWLENEGRSAVIASSSRGLIEDIVALVRSLGGVTGLIRSKKTTHRDSHQIFINLPFNPFLLRRKAKAWRKHTKYLPRRMISDVCRAGRKEVVCIEVEAADGLYVADHFLVTHNTTIAMAALGYKLHCISCLRDPAEYYGLLPGSLVIFGIYSITKKQVADTGYFKLRGWIDTSPYFRNDFPRSMKIDSKIDFKPGGQNLQVIPGSMELHALGLDLYSFSMDEVNFMRERRDKDRGVIAGQAYDLYNATHARIMSRFIRPGGTIPGIMLLMSSRKAQTSFLEERLKKAKDTEHTYVSDYALWDVKPKAKYTLPKFRVEIGDRVAQSRILEDGEDARDGSRVVGGIPGEFKPAFVEDIDEALRDIAGVATFNVSPLIRDRESIYDAVRDSLIHPFTKEEAMIDYKDDVMLDEYFVVSTSCRIEESKWRPRLNPTSARFMHVDLSLSGDCAGIAMGHVSGLVRRTQAMPDGTWSVVEYPFIIMDFMLRINPPPASEIDLSKIRAFVVYISKLYPLAMITFDGFQSADSKQLLQKAGFDARLQSIDKTDKPYLSVRSAHFERRIAISNYEPYIGEVLDLQRDVKKQKVNHPTKATRGGKGSKDVSDAVAGVVWACMTDSRAIAGATLLEDGRELGGYVKRQVVDPKAGVPLAEQTQRSKKVVGGQSIDMRTLSMD
jgi:hypothetical protein